MRFYHGTDWASAEDLRDNGLDESKAAHYNGSGEFWATTDPIVATWFAHGNPANGIPARFEFDLSDQVFQRLLTAPSPGVVVQVPNAYEFLPESFELVNLHMSNQQIVRVP